MARHDCEASSIHRCMASSQTRRLNRMTELSTRSDQNEMYDNPKMPKKQEYECLVDLPIFRFII